MSPEQIYIDEVEGELKIILAKAEEGFIVLAHKVGAGFLGLGAKVETTVIPIVKDILEYAIPAGVEVAKIVDIGISATDPTAQATPEVPAEDAQQEANNTGNSAAPAEGSTGVQSAPTASSTAAPIPAAPKTQDVVFKQFVVGQRHVTNVTPEAYDEYVAGLESSLADFEQIVADAKAAKAELFPSA